MSLIVDFLAKGRPGRALTLLARTPIPLVQPNRFADREPSIAREDASPLVEEVTVRAPGPGTVLLGDVVVKDQVDVAGMRTGVGCADGGELATEDAPLVARIIAAGGRIIGKAKMTELGMDGLGSLMHYAMPRNPRAPGYVPGGSSTGTAVAVASGLARWGVGGDGLGSIRIPAAFCGLVGLKPTRTRIERKGIRSPVRSLDAVGPITRTVEDCALMWQVMVGEAIAPITPWVPDKVGVPVIGLRAARSVTAAFHRALEALSIEIERTTIPGLESATFLGGMTGAYELSTGPMRDRTITGAGRTSLALGGAFAPADVARLEAQRAALCEATDRALARTPILAMPTTAIPPPALTSDIVAGKTNVLLLRSLGAYTPLANLCDLPSIAVPCGEDDRGRPLSIMFVAGKGQETRLLQLALAVERTGLGRTRV